MTRLSSRHAAKTICRLAALATAVCSGVAAAAEDRSAADVYLIVVGTGDVSADFAEQLGGVLASLTLAIEHVNATFISFNGLPLEGSDSSPWRPGLTLELWWL